MKDRTANGQYIDYIDFCMRMSKVGGVNKLVKENLVRAGAFNWDTSYNQRTMVENTELIQKVIKKFEDKITTEEIRALVLEKMTIVDADYTAQEKLDLERTVLNFYITSHPVLQYQLLFSLFSHINFITPSQINEQGIGTRAVVLGLVESKMMKTTARGDPFLSMKVGDQNGAINMNIWSPLAETVYPNLVDGQLVLMSGVVKEDKFRAGDNQINVSSVSTINAINGFPIGSFYAEDEPTINRIATLLDAKIGTISAKMLNRGHAVQLKELAYIRPEQYSELRKCGMAQFALSI